MRRCGSNSTVPALHKALNPNPTPTQKKKIEKEKNTKNKFARHQ
jgi:hypothetical protein